MQLLVPEEYASFVHVCIVPMSNSKRLDKGEMLRISKFRLALSLIARKILFGKLLTLGQCFSIPLGSMKCNIKISSIDKQDSGSIAKVFGKDSQCCVTLDTGSWMQKNKNVAMVDSSTNNSCRRLHRLVHCKKWQQCIASLPAAGRLEEKLRKGCILFGAPGSGKSFEIEKLKNSAPDLKVVKVNASDLFRKNIQSTRKHLNSIFYTLALSSKCMLVLENTDCLEEGRTSQYSLIILGMLLSLIESTLMKHVLFVGVTNQMERVHSSLLTSGRFSECVYIDTLNCYARQTILTSALRNLNTTEPEVLAKEIAECTPGYTRADLDWLLSAAVMLRSQQGFGLNLLELSDFRIPLASFTPSALRGFDVVTEAQTQNKVIAGLKHYHNFLKLVVVDGMFNRQNFEALGVFSPRGLLLHGPEGTGKTTMLHLLQQSIGGKATFLNVKCTDLISKNVGETERNLRAVFSEARKASPCILMFDQIDSIASVRGNDSSSEKTLDRMLSTLLTEMDGCFSKRGGHNEVTILATTNDISSLDPAILRPGRFDEHLHVDIPDSVDRELIIGHFLQEYPIQYEVTAEFSVKKILQDLVKQTNGLAGAQIKQVFEEGAMKTLRKDLSACKIEISDILISK